MKTLLRPMLSVVLVALTGCMAHVLLAPESADNNAKRFTLSPDKASIYVNRGGGFVGTRRSIRPGY